MGHGGGTMNEPTGRILSSIESYNLRSDISKIKTVTVTNQNIITQLGVILDGKPS